MKLLDFMTTEQANTVTRKVNDAGASGSSCRLFTAKGKRHKGDLLFVELPCHERGSKWEQTVITKDGKAFCIGVGPLDTTDWRTLLHVEPPRAAKVTLYKWNKNKVLMQEQEVPLGVFYLSDIQFN